MEKINFINDTTPALNATNLNKLQQNVEDVTGDLTDLETTAKTNLVAAINEAASTGSGGDTLPIYSIVDYDGDTVPTGYEEVNSYSTSEVKTGDTWIDGKPIYRKVITDTTSRTSGNYNIAHGISNLSDVIHIETLCWQNSTTMFNATSTSPLSGSERATSYLNGSNITIRNAWECIKIVIIIEYTKTTDGGNS